VLSAVFETGERALTFFERFFLSLRSLREGFSSLAAMPF
jgi:hypothetical protein